VRRYVRPFFLDPVTQKELPRKRYYDIATWLTTQVIFDFVLCPFYILQLDDTLRVWGRLYYHTVIAVGLSFAFFASPGKKWLRDKLEHRARVAGVRMSRSISTESVTQAGIPLDKPPMLGLSQDPEKDVQEMVKEIKEEVDRVKAEQAAKLKTADANKSKTM
jgi:lysophospholipid acyltransferase